MNKVYLRAQVGFSPILLIISVFVIALVTGGAFYMGKINGFVYTMPFRPPQPLVTKVPVNVDSVKTEESEDFGVDVGKYTVSFTRDGEQVFLRYRDKYYGVPTGNQYGVNELTTGLYNADSLNWTGLVNPPDDVDHGGFDDILSFKVLPGNKNFIFTTRWEKHDGDKVYLFINVYYFDPDLGKNKIVNLYSANSVENTAKSFAIPIVDQISPDGKFVSFNMHPCWNCDGRPSEKMLLNLETNQSKKINWVLEFKWENGGKYFYKDYIEKICEGDTVGPCTEDPKDLPTKQGQF